MSTFYENVYVEFSLVYEKSLILAYKLSKDGTVGILSFLKYYPNYLYELKDFFAESAVYYRGGTHLSFT